MIRFLADANLNHAIVTGCLRQEPTMDFLAATDAGLEGMPDSEVLVLAARQGRILVTHDFRTMPLHFGEFLTANQSSPGVFLVRQDTPISQVIESLVLVWSASDESDWDDRILELPL